jgi:hypothetical protein
MKQQKYTGLFINPISGNTYTESVTCSGFLQAFFLLTADAIRSARHYQLDSIIGEDEEVTVGDIIKCCKLLQTKK